MTASIHLQLPKDIQLTYGWAEASSTDPVTANRFVPFSVAQQPLLPIAMRHLYNAVRLV